MAVVDLTASFNRSGTHQMPHKSMDKANLHKLPKKTILGIATRNLNANETRSSRINKLLCETNASSCKATFYLS